MGIDISAEREIRFNADHERRIITAVRKNPKITIIGTHPRITVYSIYQRTKFGDTDRDGNPLIYSLKGINNYTITNKEFYKFKSSFIIILNKIKQKIPNLNYLLIAMPSSSAVSVQFTKKIARRFGIPMYKNCFIKQTVSEVIMHYHTYAPDVKPAHKKAIHRTLSELQKLPVNTIFSMKRVPNKVRHYFSPWKLNPDFDYNQLNNSEIILVDDLLSTGTTLISAAGELQRTGLTCSLAICLLSNL